MGGRTRLRASEIIEWPSDGHNGAALAFGADGMLFVTQRRRQRG